MPRRRRARTSSVRRRRAAQDPARGGRRRGRAPDGTRRPSPYGRPMTRHDLTILAAGALCATALAAAPAAPARADTLDRELSRLTHAGAPGAVALARRGEHTRILARGYADRATRRPMRAGDRFRI